MLFKQIIAEIFKFGSSEKAEKAAMELEAFQRSSKSRVWAKKRNGFVLFKKFQIRPVKCVPAECPRYLIRVQSKECLNLLMTI